MKTYIFTTFLLIINISLITACGGNIFSTFNKNDTSAGDSALNSGDYDAAIDAFETALDDPSLSASEKDEVREKLAAAYMGRSGVDVITILEKSDTAGGSGFESIMAFTPDATSQNVSDINKSVSLLTAIPNPTPTQSFQTGLAQTTQAFLTVKQVVNATEDGQDVNMDATTAATAVTALSGAASAFDSAGGEDTEGFGDKVEAINSQIASDPEGLNGVVNEAINK